MVAIRPARISVIENAAHVGGLGIDSDVVKSEIAVNKNMIIRCDGHAVVCVKSIVDLRQKAWIINCPRQAFPDPVAGFRPCRSYREPGCDVFARDERMLFGEDQSNCPADATRQRPVRRGKSGHTLWVASARDDGTHVPPLIGFEEDPGDLERAALGQEAQDASLDLQTLTASLVCREPCQALVWQPYQPTILAGLDA